MYSLKILAALQGPPHMARVARPGVAGRLVYLDGHVEWIPFPGEERDHICGYCGTNNGSHGELRWGFDCHYCGSN